MWGSSGCRAALDDPAIAADGYSYDRENIESWFRRGNRTSLKTGAALEHTHLIPNHTLRIVIQEFLADSGARD